MNGYKDPIREEEQNPLSGTEESDVQQRAAAGVTLVFPWQHYSATVAAVNCFSALKKNL